MRASKPPMTISRSPLLSRSPRAGVLKKESGQLPGGIFSSSASLGQLGRTRPWLSRTMTAPGLQSDDKALVATTTSSVPSPSRSPIAGEEAKLCLLAAMLNRGATSRSHRIAPLETATTWPLLVAATMSRRPSRFRSPTPGELAWQLRSEADQEQEVVGRAMAHLGPTCPSTDSGAPPVGGTSGVGGASLVGSASCAAINDTKRARRTRANSPAALARG